MSRVHVAMIMRNEKDRHLARSLSCAADVADAMGGGVFVTDDCSDDGTAQDVLRWASDFDHVEIRANERPIFMENEGRARQVHLDWVGEHVDEGDWVLSLDADETVNSVDALRGAVNDAWGRDLAVLVPLYEFWLEDPPLYRVDGFWFGTLSTRLFRWKDGGAIRDKEFGCGSEPTYVADAVRAGNVHRQKELHLLHWGYVNPRDRLIKHDRYSKRRGGHGHHSKHIRSIIDANPTLRPYEGDIKW